METLEADLYHKFRVNQFGDEFPITERRYDRRPIWWEACDWCIWETNLEGRQIIMRFRTRESAKQAAISEIKRITKSLTILAERQTPPGS